MLPLRQRYPHPTLDNIFQRPPSAIPYEEAPEVTDIRVFPADPIARVDEIEVRCLGRNPYRFIYPSPQPAPAAFRIIELRDVLMYRGILYSRDGRFFADSAFQPTRWNHPNSIRRSIDRVWSNTPVFQAEFFPAAFPAYMVSLGSGRFPMPRPVDFRVGEVGGCCLHYFDSSTIHFGHALLETVEKLWAVEMLNGAEKPSLWCAWLCQSRIQEDILAAAKAFGFGRGDFLTSPEAAVFKKIYLATSCYRYGAYSSELAVSVFRRIADHYASSRDPRAPRRLYVSRTGERNRPLVDEEKCEKIFRRRGFTVVHPERLGWAEWMPLFAHATHVAGCMGSAMHRRLFMRPESRMLHLTPDLFQGVPDYSFTEAAFGRSLNLIAGTFLEHPGTGSDWAINGITTTVENGPWKIDMRDLEEGLEQWLDD